MSFFIQIINKSNDSGIEKNMNKDYLSVNIKGSVNVSIFGFS